MDSSPDLYFKVRFLRTALLGAILLASCKKQAELNETAAATPPQAPVKTAPSSPQRDIDLLTQNNLPAKAREAALRRLITGNPNIDPQIGAAVASFFPDYSPSILSLLLSKMPRDDHRAVFLSSYRDYLNALPDMSRLAAHLKMLPKGDDRSFILQGIAAAGPLFSAATFAQFEKEYASSDDRSDFALGIYERLSAIRGDGPLLSAAKQYLSAAPSATVGQVIMQSLVKRGVFSRVDGLSDWLLTLPPEIAGIGDLPLLTRLAGTVPRKGIDYLQKLLDQTPSLPYDRRANAALEGFAEQFSRSRPAEAFSWALNLPEDLGDTRTSVLINAWSTLHKWDPALADEYAESVTDSRALEQIRTRQRRATAEKESPTGKRMKTSREAAQNLPLKR